MPSPYRNRPSRPGALERLAEAPLMRRSVISLVAAAVAGTALTAAPVSGASRPDVLPLPPGWQPEGIAAGTGSDLFVGSIPTGRVVRVDARTGNREVVVPQREGRMALGLKADRGRLFVAGGPTGRAFVYDADTGADLADVTLSNGPSFINDVTVTKDAAFFTDSQRQQLYRLALDEDGAPASSAQILPISGDMQYDAEPQTFEANGIAATPDGRQLLVVQSRTGQLFRVDAATGVSRQVPIAGGDGRGLLAGDGLVLAGTRLYATQNRLDRIAVVRLDRRLTAGRVTRYVRDDRFDFPTTIAKSGKNLYTVNLRFTTPATPTTKYNIVRVPSKRTPAT